MGEPLFDLWIYLSTTPLLGLTVTLAAYIGADALYRRTGRHPAANPVLWAVLLLCGLLWITGTDYGTYFEGAQFIHFLLGPATVALAVPLYAAVKWAARSLPAAIVAVLCGAVTASGSAVGIAWLLGAGEATLLSLAPKSVTTPIAMGVSDRIGGLPSLTAVLVILTGILGAVIGPPLLSAVGIKGWMARGLAVGVTGHGIATARALGVHPVAGAFSSLAMGLNGVATAVLIPLVLTLLTG